MAKRLRRWLIRLITAAVLVGIVLTLVFMMEPGEILYGVKAGTVIDYTEAGEDITGQVTASSERLPLMQNGSLTFSMDRDGTVAVEDARTGSVWQSAVPAESRSEFQGNADLLQSLCSLTYLNDRNTPTTMYAYNACMLKNQFRIQRLDTDTIRVLLLMGEKAEELPIPTAVEKERFEQELLPKLGEEDREYLLRRYTLYSASTMTEADNPAEKLAAYPALREQDFYLLGDIGGKVIRERTQKIFEQMGYTAEDLAADNATSGYDAADVSPLFRLALDFTLEENALQVTLPAEEIAFYTDYPLLTVQPLPFFLSTSGENGSMLIPSGSGALMSFGDGVAAGTFTAPFYGVDSTTVHKETPSVMSTDTDDLSLPVYAMHAKGQTVMAIVEEGAESAVLKAERRTGSASIYADFTLLQTGYAYISDTKKTLVCASDVRAGSIGIRFCFLEDSGPDMDYGSAASVYRAYLNESGGLPSTAGDDPTLLLEMVGGVKASGEFLGLFPVNMVQNLSSFSDMEEMARPFLGSGRVTVKITGWNRGGLLTQVPGKISAAGALGGRQGLQQLTQTLESAGARVLLDLNHAYYYDHTLADGYNESRNTAILIDKSTAVLYGYDEANGSYSEALTGTWVLSPAQYGNIIQSYIQQGCLSVSSGQLARSLNSDYNRDRYIDRGTARLLVTEALDAYRQAGTYVSADNANAYALPYMSLLEELPAEAGNSRMLTKAVPFKQMVLHGTLDYTVPAVNALENMESAVLQAIETGSGLHYTFARHIDESILDTPFSYLYYSDYDRHAASALEAWKDVSEALDGLGRQTIEAHERENDVSKTVYSDGTVIYVNHAGQTRSMDGIDIDPRSWKRLDP